MPPLVPAIVRVTAPVEALFVMIVPSPVMEETAPHDPQAAVPAEFSCKQEVPEELPANFVQVVPLPTTKSPAAVLAKVLWVTVFEELLHNGRPVPAAAGNIIS
jgi:hypothetical protein